VAGIYSSLLPLPASAYRNGACAAYLKLHCVGVGPRTVAWAAKQARLRKEGWRWTRSSVGFIVRYLTAYQLGHVGAVWEPFFFGGVGKNGTEFIITSEVSRVWPIPNAGLAAAAYMIEALMGAMGTASRWRTMPWMVTFFFILVVPLGGVSIVFIIIQPIVRLF
jgi:hypothetical protein